MFLHDATPPAPAPQAAPARLPATRVATFPPVAAANAATGPGRRWRHREYARNADLPPYVRVR